MKDTNDKQTIDMFSEETVSRYYAGIGSRETGPSRLVQIEQISAALASKGWILRSGGAEGADSAFEKGAIQKEIFLPWRLFNNNPSELYGKDLNWWGALRLTHRFHPAPHHLSGAALKLMSRNAFQVLGAQLDNPVEFVLCAAGGAKFDDKGQMYDCAGGTGQAVRIAYHYKIPIYNLNIPKHVQLFSEKYL